jgi:hypothetical protein
VANQDSGTHLYLYETTDDDKLSLVMLYRVKLPGKELTDFDIVLRYSSNKDILTSIACVSDGEVALFNLPAIKDGGATLLIEPCMKLQIEKGIVCNLVRWLPFGEHNMIAVTDFLSNVFIFKNGLLFKAFLSTHGRLITDLCWIFTFPEKRFGETGGI